MANFAYMDMPLQIGFQYAGPLDKYVQFETRALADAWLNGALAYEGALVRIKESDELWHVYKVDSVNGVLTFNTASELPLTDGKLPNTYLNYTINTAAADKIVVTNDKGLVDQALLNVTAVGGEGTAGKIVKVSDAGTLDPSLLPSIAIGEDLGGFADWETAKDGVAHNPEHGDTIAIGAGEDKAIYICLQPNAETFEGKFTLLRPASGVVAISDFTAHRNNSNDEKHVTSEQITAWTNKLDAVDIVEGTNISVDVNDENGTVTISNTYELPSATTTTLGGVVVGGGLSIATEDVTDSETGTVTTKKGTISVNFTNLASHFYTIESADAKFYAVKDGEEGKVLTTNDFTDAYMEKLEGLENYTLNPATATTLGGVKIGSGLGVAEDGTISANIIWTKEAFQLNAGATEGANKYYEWSKVCEVKIFDENNGLVFPAEYKVDAVNKTTRIEFPADFPADGENTTNWTVLVGPAIQ